MTEARTNGTTSQAPNDRAGLFRDLVDVLIPGQGPWPAASTIGVHGLLVFRLTERGADRDIRRTEEALMAAGAPFDGLNAEDRTAVVQRFQEAEPKLFDRLYEAVCLAYYESPFVGEVIRKQGRPYSPRPHLTGYPMRRFHPATDTPRHGRGRFMATDDVKPVDASSLHLDECRTERWGIER